MSVPSPRVQAALRRADEALLHGARPGGAPGPFTRRAAMGDPQAPLAHVLAVLEVHGFLGDDGWLAPDVELVSMGDHFDYGGAGIRREAARSGAALLAWLAAHPKAQVTLLLGNHDVARVGELYGHDDDAFARAVDAAVALYEANARAPLPFDDPTEAAFRRAHGLPTSELAARDFAAFEAAQRAQVEALLREGRFTLGRALSREVLLTHAGVTTRELALLGAPADDAAAVALALEHFLGEAVRRWSGGPLDLMPLHAHGHPAHGEGGGFLYHRASSRPGAGEGPRPRRYAPAALPPRLTQVIGHVRDAKSREMLLGEPREVAKARAKDGALRSLRVGAGALDYRPEARRDAHLLFTDGGMRDCAPADYELLDLDALSPRSKDATRGT